MEVGRLVYWHWISAMHTAVGQYHTKQQMNFHWFCMEQPAIFKGQYEISPKLQ